MCYTAGASHHCHVPNAAVTDTAVEQDKPFESKLTRPDPSSYANHDVAAVQSFHLELRPDFSTNILSGSVTAVVKAIVADPKVVVFDVKNLAMDYSTITVDDVKTEAWLSRKDGSLGQALVIRLPDDMKEGASVSVKIPYATSKDASAVQWLSKEQTAGKEHPYLFTQCQAIHARSLLPCQDSPGLKAPYTAEITVPAPLQALMSAVIVSETPETRGNDNVWTFKQAVPIPSYLVALAVGKLEKRDIGPRSAVWSEKETVDAGAAEFVDTEKFIATAEAICGPYVWGRYDILLMPPSFPYGGMENPCLTFVTPTLLAGDRSLANVVAHEIAHSWMGNLVTNKTWESFFLNEGFTVFLERRIMAALHGAQFKALHSMIGWEDLKGSVSTFGDSHPFTCLYVKLGKEDPDDAFSSVPYEKGFTFLCYLEQVIGGEEIMNKYLRAHCDKFKYTSITADDFKNFFLEFCKENGVKAEALDSIDWDTWFNKPGMPPTPTFDKTLATEAESLARQIVEGKLDGLDVAAKSVVSWFNPQVIVFLDKLIDEQEVELNAAGTDAAARAAVADAWKERLLTVSKIYDFAASRNAELVSRWLTLSVRAGVKGLEDIAARFLASNGRMKFVRPLFRDLHNSATYSAFAQDLFKKLGPAYHGICSTMVGRDANNILASGKFVY